MKSRLYFLERLGIFGTAIIILFGILSCNKTEFMPEPVGESIPFTDTLLTVEEYMQDDIEHSLFWRIWRRSNVADLLANYDPNYSFTLFLPNNAAMESIGLDAVGISLASQQFIDSIAAYHTVPKQYFPYAFESQMSSVRVATILGHELSNQGHSHRYPVHIEGDHLFISNRDLGLVSESVLLKGASIFPINRVLKMETRSTRQVLLEDGRFSLFMGIRRHNDSVYNALARLAPAHIDLPYERQQYVRGALNESGGVVVARRNYYTVLDYLSDINYVYVNSTVRVLSERKIWPLTVFAPTDDAFKQAGFHTLDDLIAFNGRSIPESFFTGTNLLGISGYLPTDSILNYHVFGTINRIPIRVLENGSVQYLNVSPLSVSRVFYANELLNDYFVFSLSEYYQTSGANNFLSTGNSVFNPLDFIRAGEETVQLRVRGSEYEPANLVEKDIETYTGIIHVLDRLLVPPGLKLK